MMASRQRYCILPLSLTFACLVVLFLMSGSGHRHKPAYQRISKAFVIADKKHQQQNSFINQINKQTTENKGIAYQSVCYNIIPSEEECNNLTKTEKVEPQMFPLQYVSGAPGSGNDWILWLASLSRYTWPREELHLACAIPGVKAGLKRKPIKTEWRDELRGKRVPHNCLFLKTHQPWFAENTYLWKMIAARSALLLRHPYDAAFSEYKRTILMVGKSVSKNEQKQSIDGITIEQFLSTTTNITNKGFSIYLKQYIKKWKSHAKYWLTEYKNPLHILIYNYVKSNTAQEIEDLQRFFGYKFNGVNFRRHCCVMEDTLNPSLKRKPSEVDGYREVIYKKEEDIHKQMEDAVAEVNQLLKKRYAEKNLVLTRG